MKNVIYLFVLFTVCVFGAGCKKNGPEQVIDIPNGDFELWSNYPAPLNWKTNSCPPCLPPFATYIVIQDADAQHGKYAAKFIDNHVYPATAENKFAISSYPLSLNAYVKCTLNGPDAVSVKIKLFNQNAIIDSAQWIGTSSVANYTKISISIPQHNIKVDSALISIRGGYTPGMNSTGTVFWVDNLSLQ